MKDGEEGHLRELRGGGFEWRIDEPDGPALAAIERALHLWEELPGRGSSEILKSNRIRTVVCFDPRTLIGPGEAAPSSGGRWILKQYRHRDWQDRLRYRFVPSRAEREWQALRRLRALGFDAPRPLAIGERREGGVPVEGGLVMEEIPQAVSLEEALAESLRGVPSPLRPPEGTGPGGVPAGAERLLDRAGALVRAIHERGLDLPDLHSNNFLLGPGEGGEPRIHVIDLHSARFSKRVSRRRRVAGLAKLVHSLRPAVPSAGLTRLVASYLGAGEGGAAGETLLRRWLRAVEAGADRLEARRRRSRARRCFVPSTAFSVEREGRTRLYLRREVPPAHLPFLFTRAPAGTAIKSDRGGWVAREEVEKRGYLVKRRRYSWLEALRGALVGHRLRRAYRAGFALEVQGVPTPRVLALREELSFGLVREAWLVTDLIADGVSLERYLFERFLRNPRPGRAEARVKRVLSRRSGELIRSLHDAGVYSSDLSPQNIIVSVGRLGEVAESGSGEAPAGKGGGGASPAGGGRGRTSWSEGGVIEAPRAVAHVVTLADLDSVHLWRRLGMRRRKRNLVQAGNVPEGHVSRSDRLRALSAYARGEPEFLSRTFIRELREGLLREAERTLARMLRSVREGVR